MERRDVCSLEKTIPHFPGAAVAEARVEQKARARRVGRRIAVALPAQGPLDGVAFLCRNDSLLCSSGSWLIRPTEVVTVENLGAEFAMARFFGSLEDS